MKNDIFWAVSFLPVMQELFRTSKCWKKAENKRGRGGREREREREREGGREGGRVYMLLPCGCSPCPQSQFELLV